MMVPDHSLDVQIFDFDALVLSDQLSRFFEMKVAKFSIPTSTPTLSFGAGATSFFGSSTAKITYQPSASRLIVQALISPSIGRERWTLTLPIFDSRSFLPSSEKPLCGYVKESYREID